MDYRDAPEITAFRESLRAWLASYAAGHDLRLRADDAEGLQAWFRDLAAAGYVAMSFPTEYGGRGLAPIYDAVLNEELAAAEAPPPPPIAHLARTIADFGSDDLKARVLPGLLACTDVWCQGFSEPGAGSDLAGLRTRGDVEGDFVRVNGQKIWTSGAVRADWCLLFLRTERDAPKHQGLSMLVVDMRTPGIDPRSITLSTGSGEFAEVFFDDVEVPLANVVGSRGQGWEIAMHMLGFERGPADMGWTGRYARDLERVRAAAAGDAELELRAARVAVELRVLDWHVKRTLANRASTDGARASIDKLMATRVEQSLYRIAADVFGPGVVLDADDEYFNHYLYSRAQSIYGGSQQVQRSLVAQRLLGLPRG
jgi:alkylation response protein AidB-like acyl-CoA dehydrogenase